MHNTPFHIIIPARYHSTRLPGKPLLDIAGKPMIQRVVERCHDSSALSITVATDDTRIAQCVEGFSGKAIMTSEQHQTGTDRIAEACKILSLTAEAIIINVQGDEPDIPIALIQQIADGLYRDQQADIVTACTGLDHGVQHQDPSVVKVVRNQHQYALYFSRAAIPATPTPGSPLSDIRRHIGIYGYRAGYVQQLTQRPACSLEQLEKLEQLRALWYGDTVKCVDAIIAPPPGIDTQQELNKARQQSRLQAENFPV